MKIKYFTALVCAFGFSTFAFAQAWTNVGYTISGPINTAANFGGTMYIGGSFLRANGVDATHFLTYNGTVMTTPQNSNLAGTGINSLFVGTNTNLGYTGMFAVGSYNAASTSIVNTTKWSGLAWTDATFATPGTTYAMGSVITATNAVVTMVGGAFNTATLKYVAKRNATNTAWVAAGAGFDGEVYAIKNVGLDIYAAGNFTKSGTTLLNRIAKWDNTNNKWVAVGTGTAATLGFNAKVRCLEVYNGELYAGGDFTTAGGVAAKLFAKWDALNSKWVAVTGGQFTGTSVRAFANGSSGIMIVGDFTKVGTVTAKNAAFFKIAATIGTFTPYGAGITMPINTVIYYVNKWYCGQEVAVGTTNYLKIWNPTAIVATENILGSSQENINFKTVPNPASSLCNISFETPIETIEIFNITGNLILSQNNIRTETFLLNTQDFTNGIYFAKVKTTDGKTGSKKIIVAHE